MSRELLKLTPAEISDRSVTSLAQLQDAKKNKKRVINIGINRVTVGEDEIAAITDAMLASKTLIYVDISGCAIGDAGAIALAEKLKDGVEVRVLILLNNNIGDTGAAIIAEMLETNTTMVDLDLSNNDIGSAGVAAIAKALRVNKTLRTIQLDRNPRITDSDATALMHALRANKLSAVQNGIVKAKREAVEKAEMEAALIKARMAVQTATTEETKKAAEAEVRMVQEKLVEANCTKLNDPMDEGLNCISFMNVKLKQYEGLFNIIIGYELMTHPDSRAKCFTTKSDKEILKKYEKGLAEYEKEIALLAMIKSEGGWPARPESEEERLHRAFAGDPALDGEINFFADVEAGGGRAGGGGGGGAGAGGEEGCRAGTRKRPAADTRPGGGKAMAPREKEART